ncbi:MAG: CHAT domain-containing tetratricopeptide repeat protein [Acidobacteriota bacterium]
MISSFTKCRPGIWGAVPFLSAFAFALSCGLSIAATQEAQLLEPGAPLERQLALGETHRYRIELTPGNWLVLADQKKVDLTLKAHGPEGWKLDPADSPIDRLGPESLLIRSGAGGRYHVEASPSREETRPGSYQIRLLQLPGQSPSALTRLAAETARMQAAQLYFQGNAEAWHRAIGLYQEALRHWRELEMLQEQARAYYCIAVLHRLLHELEKALEYHARGLPLWQSLKLPSWQASTLNEMGICHNNRGERQAAGQFFERALPIYIELEDLFGQSVALLNLCAISLSEGQSRKAMGCYEEALDPIRRSGSVQAELAVQLNLSVIYDTLGRPQQALDANQNALNLLKSRDNPFWLARTLSNRGRIYRRLGESDQALLAWEKSLEIFRRVGDKRWQSTVLNNLGFAYLNLGEVPRAKSFLGQALDLRRQIGYRRGEAITLNNLATVYDRLDDPDGAFELNQQALLLMQTDGTPQDQARTLILLARRHIQRQDLNTAFQLAERAVALASPQEDRHRAADALQQMGRIHLLRDQPGQARQCLEETLELRRKTADPAGEVEALTDLARAERRLGRLPAARQHLESALKIIESLRIRVSSPDLRATFGSSLREAYAQYIDLLMESHRSDPHKGHLEAALEASERTRARTLTELLVEARADIRRGIDLQLGQRERELRTQLGALAESRFKLLGKPGGEAEAALMEQEIHSVLAEMDTVETQIRRQSPAYAALTRPRPLELSQIQDLLDEDTALLEYFLGEERSFLWCLTRQSATAFDLPARPVIESLARRVHQQFSTLDLRAAAQDRREAAALSRMILQPASGCLANRRLVVVADGVLHYIPFGALPAPGSDLEPLLLKHEVVYLPSASALAVQREELAGRPAAPLLVAVLADPVFEEDDPRLAQAAQHAAPQEEPVSNSSGKDPERQFGPNSIARLPSTRREAQAIAQLVPAGQAWIALDFDASRSAALDERLSQYRYVHFATHGLIDSGNPQLSGLVLSRFSKDGRHKDGFLRLRDIYNIRLGADLVVLSGCRTALGREIRGEGLVGLARGFMYAGAPRVVASLWRVQDRATAELMERFYSRMLSKGMRPAAALREAQLSIFKQRGGRDPYYWAAFVLQGDWR